MSLQSWLQLKAIAWHTTQPTVRGSPVTVISTRPDIETADVLARGDLRGVERRRFVGCVVYQRRREILGLVSTFTLQL
jgi:hypothetical protein